MDESRHVSVWIDRPADDVYAVVSDVQRLPQWAAGLATGLGDIEVEFVAPKNFGVLDHVVTLPSGEGVYNPMRVIPAARPQQAPCEVVFTVRRRGVAQDEFEADAAAVAADLKRLKELLEG